MSKDKIQSLKDKQVEQRFQAEIDKCFEKYMPYPYIRVDVKFNSKLKPKYTAFSQYGQFIGDADTQSRLSTKINNFFRCDQK